MTLTIDGAGGRVVDGAGNRLTTRTSLWFRAVVVAFPYLTTGP